MIYILTGAAAFVFLFFFDVYTLKDKSLQKYICGLAGLGLLVFSAVMAVTVSEAHTFPGFIRYPAWLLLAAAVWLLIYSLFLELPFDNTYKSKQHSTVLIDTGTYALCRHPGVLWFALLFLFFFLATGAELLIAAGIIWTCLDVLHVYLQEKLFFTRMFPGYAGYMESTPMLIPTSRSLKKCISTIIRRRNGNDKLGRNAKTGGV